MTPHEKLELMAENVATWVGSVASLIVHTLLFILMFCLYFFGVSLPNILLIATTVVSFEAIYLNVLVQMTVNKHSKHLKKHNEEFEKLKVNQ